MNLRYLSLLALSLVAATTAAKADPIVANGDFNYSNYSFPGYNDTIASWTQSGGTGAIGYETDAFWNNGTLPAGDSTVGFIQGEGSFTQGVTLVAGQQYTLTFMDNSRDLTGDNCCNSIPTLIVSVGGTELGVPQLVTAVGGSNPFFTESYTFVAGSSSEDLVFSSTAAGDGTVLLSDVSISATPEPSGLILLGTGLMGVVAAGRRKFRRA